MNLPIRNHRNRVQTDPGDGARKLRPGAINSIVESTRQEFLAMSKWRGSSATLFGAIGPIARKTKLKMPGFNYVRRSGLEPAGQQGTRIRVKAINDISEKTLQ